MEDGKEEQEKKNEQEKAGAPFLPYDITLKDNFHIYDSLAYERNKALTEDFPKMSSGKVLKYYEQKLSDETREIKNNDNKE